MKERLQKLLSQWGIASRREAENLIQSGRVTLNGHLAQLGQTADPIFDIVEVDGQKLGFSNRPALHYLLVNKPKGVVSTCEDPQGRKTVLDLLPMTLRQGTGIHPVGRLDIDSTGALLLTNDGQLTYHLTHPKHEVAKVYRVTVVGKPSQATLNQWRQGILLDGSKTLPAEVRIIPLSNRSQTLLEIILREGRNRQIRRVAKALGHPVLSLHRCAIGGIWLKALAKGDYRLVTPQELETLTSTFKENALG